MSMVPYTQLVLEDAQRHVAFLNTVEELAKARDDLVNPLRAVFNEKIRALEKAAREAKRAERTAAAEKLCQALRPGEKVKMVQHGHLDIFSSGCVDVFYNADATVHMYQRRKKLLWLNVTGTSGSKRATFEVCRSFSLLDVAQYNVRRAVD